MDDHASRGTAERDITAASGTTEQLGRRLTTLLVDVVQEYAIFALDPDGIITTWNRGACRIKGYPAEEILGQHFSVFYPPEAVRAGKPQRQLAQAREHGHSHDEGWRVRRDGSRFWADVTITAIRDDTGRLDGFAKVTRDDTDRRLIEQQVRELELLSDRDRIAREMHETVVRRIFDASDTLAGALRFIHDPTAAERVNAAIDALDATIRQIREIVLDPHSPDS